MIPSILPAFQAFLLKQQLTAKTIRNYRSDINQFLNWLTPQNPSSISPHHFTDYHHHLASISLPLSTLNRHLASLRQFAQFLNLDINLANPPLPFIPTVLKNFKAHLTKNRYKSKTVANYLSDVRHYLAWAEQQL